MADMIGMIGTHLTSQAVKNQRRGTDSDFEGTRFRARKNTRKPPLDETCGGSVNGGFSSCGRNDRGWAFVENHTAARHAPRVLAPHRQEWRHRQP